MMLVHDHSSAVPGPRRSPIPTQPHPPVPPATPATAPSGGRLPELDAALALVSDGRDVVCEGEAGMGAHAMRRAAAERARALGWLVATAATATVSPDLPRTIIIDDLDRLSTTEIGAVRAGQAQGARLLATRRPPRPFAPQQSRGVADLARDAVIITLAPLTRDQNQILLEELHGDGTLTRFLSTAERDWIWVTSGGFPALATALAHDVEEAPVTEGVLSRLSRRTVIAAADIIATLPAALQRLAAQLVPLVGVGMDRLARTFNATELGLLLETSVISEHNGLLCVPPPLRAALQLLDGPDVQPLTRSVIADICTSVRISARCLETELDLAANALAADAVLRAAVPESAHRAVLRVAMWLARRRGDIDEAAALGRRLLTLLGDAPDATALIVAQGVPDALTSYATHFTDDPERADGLTGSWNWAWLQCLQLPLTGSVPGAEAICLRVAESLADPERGYARALARTIHAAALLDEGRLDDAATGAEEVLRDEHAGPIATMRAHLVLVAVAACRLHPALVESRCRRLAAAAQAATVLPGLGGDLARRQALDALLTGALACASVGIRPPSEANAVIEALAHRALRLTDTAAVVRTTVAQFVGAITRRDEAEMAGLLRHLRQERHTDLTAWVLAEIEDGDLPPLGIASGRFVRSGVALMWMLSRSLPEGVEELRLAMGKPGVADTVLGELTATLLACVDGTAVAEHVRTAASHDLPDGTGPRALQLGVAGLSGSDPSTLAAAAQAFLDQGAPELAERMLDALAPLVAGDAVRERELRAMQRATRTSLRAQEDASEPLTLREREIARLAAEGLRNREIARRLFVSVRTVESHLYRAMRKLNVTRGELRRLADRSDSLLE
ncbi:LuxR C-terminal-related transcriptional regulator [Microbacterium gorillae]|uniref:LuxR C-terminal-related transcriptional regulator n=1 Tax=Microbacterium gorillae TaxID=1231063 RepID=UPI003D99D85C